jgi:hypothetical protein
MAILSRLPIGAVRDFSHALDGPARERGGAVTPAEALETLRLHSGRRLGRGGSDPAGPIHILASHATPPVFDGPEDRNGLRNPTSCGSGRSTSTAGRPDGPPFAADRFA